MTMPRIAGTIIVGEDKDYNIGLYRGTPMGTVADEKQLNLYHVVLDFSDVPGRRGVVNIHVLADSENAAIGQAECYCSFESYRVDDEVYALVKRRAWLLPLVIQSWGRNQF